MITKGTNSTEGVYNGTTEIEKVYKGTSLRYKNWVTKQGVPPLTLNKCRNANIKDYEIYGNSKQGELPDGYTQLEYIESTGTQTIDTSYKANLNTKLIINYQFNTFSSTVRNGRLFGCRTEENNSAFLCGTASGKALSSDSLFIQFDNVVPSYEKKVYLDLNIHKIELSKKGAYYDNELWATYNNPTSFTTRQNLLLFNMWNTSDTTISATGGRYRLYECKIYDNDILVRNFIPAKNSSNVLGMYDAVNDVFYTNQGTGTFVAGPEMPNPDTPIEIQSVGDKTKNLFDKNNATFLNGWINDLGVFISNSRYKTLDYYHVKPSTTYTLSYIKTSSDYYDRVCEYSSSIENAFVKVTKLDNRDVPLEQRVSITFSTSDTTNYIRLNMASTDPEHYQGVNIQIEQGSTATNYEPYGYKIPVNVKGKNLFDKNNTIRYRAYININYNFVGGASDSSSVSIACLPNKTYKITKHIDTAIYRACYINDEMPELGKTTPAYNVQSGTNDEIIVTTGENAKYVVIQCSNALYESFIDTLEVIDEETITNIYLDEPLRKIGDADVVRLPEGYTQLEYIESTGTQWIDTNFIPGSNKYIFSAEVMFFDANENEYKRVCGTLNSNATAPYYLNRLQYRTYEGKVRLASLANCYPAYEKQLDIFPIINEKIYMEANAFTNTATYDNVTVNVDSQIATNTNDSKLCVFVAGPGGTPTNRMRLYYLKVSTLTDISLNLIPCKNSSNLIGMYDTVTNTFYTNAGTGDFTAGPEIYADYIDYETQKVYRNVVVDDDTGTLPIDQSYHGTADTTGTTVELPDILLNKGTNIIDIETSITPSNLWLKYKGKE